jgi:GT2 family glycosyltransferase
MSDLANPVPAAPAPRFSILIPSYRSLRFLNDCLGSILRARGDFEVLFLDNGSPEPEAEWLDANMPDPRLRVFKGGVMRYFAGGINFMAERARGEFLVLLNSDTHVEPDWLEKLDAYLRASGFDGAQADLRDAYPPRRSEAGYNIDRMGLLVSLFEKDLPPSHEVFCMSASCFAMRRTVFHEAGGMDESFRMYFEDIDLGWRATLLGYRFGYASGAIVHHVGQGSWGRTFFPWHEFRVIRNCGLSFVKNAGPGLLATFLLLNLLLRVARLPLNLLTGKFGRAAGELAAVASFLWLAGPALKKRAKIQAARRVSDAELVRKGYIARLKYFGKRAARPA